MAMAVAEDIVAFGNSLKKLLEIRAN